MKSHPLALAAWLAAAALSTAQVSAAADDPDDMGGFDDEEEYDVEFDTSSTDEADRWWNVDGSVGVSSSINWNRHYSAFGTNYSDLQRLRLRLNLELDARLPFEWKFRATPYVWYDFAYLIQGKGNYSPQVLNEYEWEIDFQDTYFEGPLLDNVDLKIGRQVVNWGRSDSLRILDRLNPLDQREPGRADIEDLAWSVGMAKVDWYVDRHWTVTAIAIPEMRFTDIPFTGSDFNPSPTQIVPIESPDSFDHWEAAASVRGIFEGWDVSFHYAYLYRNLPSLRVLGFGPTGPDFKQVYTRQNLAGVGGNYTFGSWLVKGELAYLDGFEFAFQSGERARVDLGIGVEYYGISDHTFVLEVVERHLFNHTPAIRAAPSYQRENTVEYALRWTADWMNARLTTTVLAILFGYKVQDGAIIRAQGEYEIMSGMTLTVGILMYQSGKLPPLRGWGENDRVFIDLKYSF